MTATTTNITSYLATLYMGGVRDCSIPFEKVPRGPVLWHGLSIMNVPPGNVQKVIWKISTEGEDQVEKSEQDEGGQGEVDQWCQEH